MAKKGKYKKGSTKPGNLKDKSSFFGNCLKVLF